MAQYRIAKYDCYPIKGFCIEYKGIFSLWRWKPVRDIYGEVVVEKSYESAEHLLRCWTSKAIITPI